MGAPLYTKLGYETRYHYREYVCWTAPVSPSDGGGRPAHATSSAPHATSSAAHATASAAYATAIGAPPRAAER